MRSRRERSSGYEIEPIGTLPPLEPFQRGILRGVRVLLDTRSRAMVSSFTGTGKTRVGLEFVVDTLLSAAEEGPLVAWVAQKRELLDQACDAIEQLWPWRGQECGEPLRVFRDWEGSRFDEKIPARPTPIVASSQQVVAWLESHDPFVRTALSRARRTVGFRNLVWRAGPGQMARRYDAPPRAGLRSGSRSSAPHTSAR